MKYLAFIIFLASAFTVVQAQPYLSESGGYFSTTRTLEGYSAFLKKAPRYDSCCICQFNDTNDSVGDSASGLCDEWLAKQSCSFKTKIRDSLSFEPKNIFPYYEYVTGPYCGNIAVQHEGHGNTLDRSKQNVFSCLRMMGPGGKLKFTDTGCSTFEDVFETERAASDLLPYVGPSQSIYWTGNQSHSTGIAKSGWDKMKREIDEQVLKQRPLDWNVLRKPLPDSVYAPIVSWRSKVGAYLAVPYGGRLNTPTTAVIKPAGVAIVLPQCSVLNNESIARFGNVSTCVPEHAQIFCNEGGVTRGRVCCGPDSNHLKWIVSADGYCPNVPRPVPAVTPQF